MLRSAFRGKHTSGTTTDNEKDKKWSHGRSNSYSHREVSSLNGEGEFSLKEVHSDSDGENADFQEFREVPFSRDSSHKETVSNEEEEELSKFLESESGLANEGDLTSHHAKVKDHIDRSFSDSERQVYEMQLAQLQEQLVTTMIEYQEMGCQLKKLKSVNVEKLQKDLHEEREKNRELKEKLKQQKKASTSKLQRKNASRSDPRTHTHSGGAENITERFSEDWVDLGKVEGMHLPTTSSQLLGNEEHPIISPVVQDNTCEIDGIRLEPPPGQTDEGGGSGGNGHRVHHVRTKLENFKNKAVEMIIDRLWDFVNDEPETIELEDGEGEPLSVKKLKENINRFTAAIKPITSFVKSVGGIFSWSNPTASFLTFVVYMYSVWRGYLLPLLLLIMIWKLFINYLHARGIAKQLGFVETAHEETTTSDDKTWSDKFHLVLEVARKVQNTLGEIADSLEKVKNLLNWQHHEAARKLFTSLCISCVASLLLRGPTLFMIVGLILGIKLFIVSALYRRFPKVKKRYDSTARLWKELPKDADLAERDMTDMHQHTIQRASSASSIASTSGLSSEPTPQAYLSNHFAEKFRLAPSETPLPDWDEGRRCVLLDKDKPLSSFKHGKLYLTQSYLCFEKMRSSTGKNITIKLKSVTSLSKAKPIGLMPGTGMAIELHVRGVEKPYIFGGIIGRDDVYESIVAAGRAANIQWALT